MVDKNNNERISVKPFNKFECIWNPKDACNPKLYDSYAYLDLNLNQFLSIISEDASYLPNSIYKPRLFIYMNDKLVYMSKVLDYRNDLFNESIRLKIYSPNTIITLKLFECEEFNLNLHTDDDKLMAVLSSETTNKTLVSWVELDVSLFIPDREYNVICSFKSNPSFYTFNPGGILTYPFKSNIPDIHSIKVCASCKVCLLLSHQCVGSDIKYKRVFDYFDYNMKSSIRNRNKYLSTCKDNEIHEIDQDSVTTNQDVSDNDLIIQSNLNECKCVSLNDLLNYNDTCLKCHDHENCCDHSLDYYYVSINFTLKSSSTDITPITEILSSMLTPHLIVKTNEQSIPLITIFERLYQNYHYIKECKQKISESISNVINVKIIIIILLIGMIFHKSFIALVLLLMSYICFQIHKSYNHIHNIKGNSLEHNMNYIDPRFNVTNDQVIRNNFNIPLHDVKDDVKLYTKMYKSYSRRENIALKTLFSLFNDPAMNSMKRNSLTVLSVSDSIVHCINGFLVIIRYYGLLLSIILLVIGTLSMFHQDLCIFCFKVSILLIINMINGFDSKYIDYSLRILKYSVEYFVHSLHRNEWFLNQ